MTAAQYEQMLPPLSPRELLTGELPALLSFWTFRPTSETAQALLAVWAGLQRLEGADIDSDEDRLNALVREEGTRLFDIASEGTIFNADNWIREANDLACAMYPGTHCPEELDWQAHRLFDRLDRANLFIWALAKLGQGQFAAQLAIAKGTLEEADSYMASRAETFLSLADDVADVLSAARKNLHDQEPDLWETLLRHRRIEEARDELETVPDGAIVLASARLYRATMVQSPKQVPAYLSTADQRALVFRPANTAYQESYVSIFGNEVDARLAAQSSPDARTTVHGPYPISGDDAVRVELDLQRTEILVHLNQQGKYLKCELGIPGVPAPLIGEFGATARVRVRLTETDVRELREHGGSIALTLISLDGTRRAVDLAGTRA